MIFLDRNVKLNTVVLRRWKTKMKKVGKQVLMLATGNDNPRNGEGDFVRLSDGRIMYAYTRYSGDDWNDHCPADIVAIYSSDEGESWTREKVLFAHDEKTKNFMCANLFRTNAEKLGIIYLRKDINGAAVPCFSYSEDEGKSWSDAIECINSDKYYVLENGKVIRLSSGRILIPLNYHPLSGDNREISFCGEMVFVASDDDGKSWFFVCDPVCIPYDVQNSGAGLQETVVYEKNDGSLRAYSRTDLFCQYESTSKDGGCTWSVPVPNVFFSSPLSPLGLKKSNRTVYAVFNPTPVYTSRDGDKTNPLWHRTPLVLSASSDDGANFEKVFFLEDDPDNTYCYPAIFDGGDYLLVAYYHSNDSKITLSSCKISKIMKSEME